MELCRSSKTLIYLKLNNLILRRELLCKHQHKLVFCSIFNQTHAHFFTSTCAAPYFLSGSSHVIYEMLDTLNHMDRTRKALSKYWARRQLCTPTLTHEHTLIKLNWGEKKQADLFYYCRCARIL